MSQHRQAEALDLYAVFGNPIAHSKSPFIHRAFAEQTQQSLRYISERIELDNFENACDEFFNKGGCGLNVTLPFKQQAWQFADQLSEDAQLAGAVNTLTRKEGHIFGDNTDGTGLVADIRDILGWPIKGKRLLVLGAGGAVRGVLKPLLDCEPLELTLANRTPERALELASHFASYGKVAGCGFEDVQGSFDLVINGTSASLQGKVPPLARGLFTTQGRAYDMVYAEADTPFMTWAAGQGALNVADGLGMLVGQAAESFFIWRGVRPDILPVLEAIRSGET